MKPTSIIFIIIAVMMASVGLLLCFTASNMANDQGVALFTQTGDADSNYTSVHEFDGAAVKKLVLNMSDTTVNIIGGADSNRVEMVNFPDGTYDLSIGKSTLQLSDASGIGSFIDIDNFKINFNGFRDYLHYFKYRDKKSSVNVYFTDDASAIILSVTSGGDVNLQDLRLDCDYKVIVSKGDVNVSNVKTDSSIDIDSTDDSSVNISASSFNEIIVNGVTAYTEIKNTTFTRSMYINIKSGSVSYDRLEPDFTGFNLLLRADSGVIKYNSERIINGKYEEKNYIDISADTGEEEETETDTGDDSGGGDTAQEGEGEGEETTAAEGTGPEVPANSTQIPAYSVTIILGEGNIEVY